MTFFPSGLGFDSSAMSSSTCISTSRLSSAVSFFVGVSALPPEVKLSSAAIFTVLDLRTLVDVSVGKGFMIFSTLLVLLLVAGGTRDSLTDFFGAIFFTACRRRSYLI